VSPLNSGGFGSKTGLDVVHDFFENKLSPAASIVRDVLKIAMIADALGIATNTYSGKKKKP
jgi:hypothetical protein